VITSLPGITQAKPWQRQRVMLAELAKGLKISKKNPCCKFSVIRSLKNDKRKGDSEKLANYLGITESVI
jgi:hypothetical protein